MATVAQTLSTGAAMSTSTRQGGWWACATHVNKGNNTFPCDKAVDHVLDSVLQALQMQAVSIL